MGIMWTGGKEIAHFFRAYDEVKSVGDGEFCRQNVPRARDFLHCILGRWHFIFSAEFFQQESTIAAKLVPLHAEN